MKRAIMRIGFDRLAKMLKLPEGIEIQQVVPDYQYNGITVGLSGDGLPSQCVTLSGRWTPSVVPVYSEGEDGNTTFDGWEQ
jgi:hypothetical protein